MKKITSFGTLFFGTKFALVLIFAAKAEINLCYASHLFGIDASNITTGKLSTNILDLSSVTTLGPTLDATEMEAIYSSTSTWTSQQTFARSMFVQSTSIILTGTDSRIGVSVSSPHAKMEINQSLSTERFILALTTRTDNSPAYKMTISTSGTFDLYPDSANMFGINIFKDSTVNPSGSNGTLSIRGLTNRDYQLNFMMDTVNTEGFINSEQPGTGWLTTNLSCNGCGSVGIRTVNPGTLRTDVGGDLNVTGTLTKGGGTFKIPHPLKEDKWLYHGFVEAPEYGLLYRGQAQLQNGLAQIIMPDYFESMVSTIGRTVNLTSLNGYSPLYVDGDIVGGTLTVRTNIDGNQSQNFYWTVYGRRGDPFVMAQTNIHTDSLGNLKIEQSIANDLTPKQKRVEREVLNKDEDDAESINNAIKRQRKQYYGYETSYNLLETNQEKTIKNIKNVK